MKYLYPILLFSLLSLILIIEPVCAIGSASYYTSDTGTIQYSAGTAGTNWYTVHNSGSGTSASRDTAATSGIRSTAYSDPLKNWNYISRGYYIFDTSSIPDGESAYSAYLKFKVVNLRDDFGDEMVSIVDFTPGDPASITVDDYDEFSEVVTITYDLDYFTSGQFYNLSIDPDLINSDGYTCIGFRTEMRDRSNNSAWLSNKISYFSISNDNYAPDQPILYVYYASDVSIGATVLPAAPEQYTTATFIETVTGYSGGSNITFYPRLYMNNGTYEIWSDEITQTALNASSDIYLPYDGDYQFLAHANIDDADYYSWYNFTVSPRAYPTPTPTGTGPYTVTVTATPTPRPFECSYWTAALSSYQIPRGGNTTITLTESDPSDNYDKIEYWNELPNGQKIPQAYFINDPGFFGLGAGWIKIDPVTNSASASSLVEAMSYLMDFSVSGTNKIYVDIYDDKSLIRTVYSDYEIVCGFVLDVVVGGPTYVPEDVDGDGDIDQDDIDYTNQQIGINVFEADTKAIVYDVTVSVQDLTTGSWDNQTSTYGQTLYYYTNPGKNIRIYVNKSPWTVYDKTITVPNPPGIYGVYLNRPIISETGYSWVIFAVKEASTLYPISGANIALDTGENKTTNSAGGAQFNLTEGGTVYYTISKYGYFSNTGYMTVPADDYYPTIVLNRNAAEPLYTPIPTGTSQIIGPTGTTTLAPGQNGSGWLPGGDGLTAIPTLDTSQRAERTEQSLSIWYANLPMLSNFFLMLILVGGLGMILDTFNLGGRRRRR